MIESRINTIITCEEEGAMLLLPKKITLRGTGRNTYKLTLYKALRDVLDARKTFSNKTIKITYDKAPILEAYKKVKEGATVYDENGNKLREEDIISITSAFVETPKELIEGSDEVERIKGYKVNKAGDKVILLDETDEARKEKCFNYLRSKLLEEN